jgi:hypothetical protein
MYVGSVMPETPTTKPVLVYSMTDKVAIIYSSSPEEDEPSLSVTVHGEYFIQEETLK